MAEEKEKLARGIVARGRTVRVPHPTETTVIGVNPETGKPMRGPKVQEFGPGQEVTLPEGEIKSFRALGYLEDPDKVADPAAEGSHLRETA